MKSSRNALFSDKILKCFELMEQRDGRYFPTAEESEILTRYLKEYFSYPERSTQRANVVTGVVDILSKKNKHWTNRTVRLWFSNNKRLTTGEGDADTPNKNYSVQNSSGTSYNNNNSSNNSANGCAMSQSSSIPMIFPHSPDKATEQSSNNCNSAVNYLEIRDYTISKTMKEEYKRIKELLKSDPDVKSLETSKVNISSWVERVNKRFWFDNVYHRNEFNRAFDQTSEQSEKPFIEYPYIESSICIPKKPPVLVTFNNDCQILSCKDISTTINMNFPVSSMAYNEDLNTFYIHSGSTLATYVMDNNEFKKAREDVKLKVVSNNSSMSFNDDVLYLGIDSTVQVIKHSDLIENEVSNFSITCSLGSVTSVVGNHDTIITASRDHHTAYVFRTQYGTLQNLLIGHLGGITCMSMLSNNNVVTGSSDLTVKLWDTRNYAPVFSYLRHQAPVTCLYVEKDIIVSGGADSQLKCWDIRNCRFLWCKGLGGAIPQSVSYDIGSGRIDCVCSEKVSECYLDMSRYPQSKENWAPQNCVITFDV